MSTIPAMLHANAAQWPDRDALISTIRGRDRVISFAQLEASADRFADELLERKIRPKDPVLVFIPMSIELYIALLGLFRIGAVAVFVDPSAGLKYINACCAKLPPSGLITLWQMRFLRPFAHGLRIIPQVFSPPTTCDSGSTKTLPGYPPAEDAALITFTSGSTGQPKAAVRSHRFLLAQYEALKDSIELVEGERDLTTLPVFVLANLAAGITSILPDAKISRPGSVDADRIAAQLKRLSPNRTGGSPAFYQQLLKSPGSLAGFRKIYTGGAPVFPSLLQKLQEAASLAEVTAVYGSTEAEPIAHVSCKQIDQEDWDAMRGGRGLLAGKPVPQVSLRILPDQWGKPIAEFSELSNGKIGEIVVTGEHVLKSYLHAEGDEETKVKIEDEIWHRTGDAGYLDERGRLWLMGRCSACIDGALYPFAVECVAMTFSFVHRAAFIEVNDKRLLIVQPESKLTSSQQDELLSACAWAEVEEVRELRLIPVDARHNAKINYPKLRKMLSVQSV